MMPLAQALWDMRDAAPAPPAPPPVATGATPDAAADPDLEPAPDPYPAAGQVGDAAGRVKAEAGDEQPEGAVPIAAALQAKPGASAAMDAGAEQSVADGQLPEAAAAVPGLRADPEASAPSAATPAEGGAGQQPREAAPAAQAPAAGPQGSPRAASKGAAGEGVPNTRAPDAAADPCSGPRSLKRGRPAPERARAAAPADGAAAAAADAREAREGGPRAKRRHAANGGARAAQGSGRAGGDRAEEEGAGAGVSLAPPVEEAAPASPAATTAGRAQPWMWTPKDLRLPARRRAQMRLSLRLPRPSLPHSPAPGRATWSSRQRARSSHLQARRQTAPPTLQQDPTQVPRRALPRAPRRLRRTGDAPRQPPPQPLRQMRA